MPSDQELMERVIRDDDKAFDGLFERYESAVRGQVRRIVRDMAAVDDLLQEVFLRLWSHADQWRGTGTVKSWLLRTATNLALNHLRGVKRRRSQPLTGSPGDEEEDDDRMPDWMIDEVTPRPDGVLDRSERCKQVRELVNALPDRHREVIRLVYEMEMKVHEAAEELNVPSGTVKSRLHYAKSALAREWNEHE